MQLCRPAPVSDPVSTLLICPLGPRARFEYQPTKANKVLVAIGNVLAQQRQLLRTRHHLKVPLQTPDKIKSKFESQIPTVLLKFIVFRCPSS